MLEKRLRVPGHPVYAYVGPDVVCVRGEDGRREAGGERETRKMRIAEMDRCLELESYRLRDITESRSEV